MPISTFLNNRVPTRLRGLQFLALSDSAAIQRRTAATDNGGAATWTWATISTVPCRVYPLTPRGQSRLTGGALDEKTTHYLTAPLGTQTTYNLTFKWTAVSQQFLPRTSSGIAA